MSMSISATGEQAGRMEESEDFNQVSLKFSVILEEVLTIAIAGSRTEPAYSSLCLIHGYMNMCDFTTNHQITLPTTHNT